MPPVVRVVTRVFDEYGGPAEFVGLLKIPENLTSVPISFDKYFAMAPGAACGCKKMTVTSVIAKKSGVYCADPKDLPDKLNCTALTAAEINALPPPTRVQRRRHRFVAPSVWDRLWE